MVKVHNAQKVDRSHSTDVTFHEWNVTTDEKSTHSKSRTFSSKTLTKKNKIYT